MKKVIQLLMLSMMIFGCSEPAPVNETPEAAVETTAVETVKNPVEREVTVGPVHAVVLLDNEKPVLGEHISLTLRVDAADGVRVMMPEFGDQLGRFEIADYDSSERILPDGRTEYEQKYVLDLPRSGRLRTPAFMIEFEDKRENAENPGKIQEILTEEISFEASSVFADGEVPPELFGAHGALGELVIPTKESSNWWIWVIAGVALVSGIVVVCIRRRRKPEVVLPPDVVAINALHKMEEEKIPSEAKEIDGWYVCLSSIVRCYIEGRFKLEAPRMTTEEFFELARRSSVLSDVHKDLIHELLERSDRVKFTDYLPSKDESEKILGDARRFVEETREVREEGESSHV